MAWCSGSARATRKCPASTLGGIFEQSLLDEPLCGAELTNAALLQAIEAFSVLAKRRGGRQLVYFRHLGAEELGSVYEALLELAAQSG